MVWTEKTMASSIFVHYIDGRRISVSEAIEYESEKKLY